jgi:hypothetical protein
VPSRAFRASTCAIDSPDGSSRSFVGYVAGCCVFINKELTFVKLLSGQDLTFATGGIRDGCSCEVAIQWPFEVLMETSGYPCVK